MKRVTSPFTPAARANKQRRINEANKQDDGSTSDGRVIVNEILNDIKATRMNLMQQQSDSETKKRRIEQLKAEREAIKSQKALLMQELHAKNAALAEAKVRSREIIQKVSEYQAKVKRILELKAQLKKRISLERNAVDGIVASFQDMASRCKKAHDDAVECRNKVQTELEKAFRKVEIAETEYKQQQSQYQGAIEEKRKDWNEMTDLLDNTRRKSEALRGEIEKKQNELEKTAQKAAVTKDRLAEATKATKELEQKLAREVRYSEDIDKLTEAVNAYENMEGQLDQMKDDLQAKIGNSHAELQAVEREVAQDVSTLSDLTAQENLEQQYHNEKVAALQTALQEKLRAYEKLEEDVKASQDKRKTEWEEKEKQRSERMAAQQRQKETLKREFEFMSGQLVQANIFDADCQDIKEFALKMRQEKERVVLEIEALKQRSREVIVLDENVQSAGPKMPKTIPPQPKILGAAKTSTESHSKKSDPKHVTFKNTPTIYEPPSSQQSSSQKLVTPKAAPVVSPKPIIRATSSPRTPPSAAKSTPPPPTAPLSRSVVARGRSALWLYSPDSSDGDDIPQSKPIIRRPAASKRNKPADDDDFLGIF